MILVTVGLHGRPFERLVQAADEMAQLVDEPVVIQRGVTQFTPQFAKYFDFADEVRMGRCLTEARVVISHGGAGSILSALQIGKPLVVVPRLVRCDEHIDDHQSELAEALYGQGKAVVIEDLSAEKLRKAIAAATQLAGKASSDGRLQAALRVWLVDQAKQPVPKRIRLLRLGR